MAVFKAQLNKETLSKIPKLERDLFVAIAHLQNEIRFSLYGVVWTHDFSSHNDAILAGQIAFNFFHLRGLAGKIHAGWQLLQKNYFPNKELSVDFCEKGNDETRLLLKELGKYFGKKNAISEIRNKFSSHYSPEELGRYVINMPDELEMYIAKENDANTLYYFAEVSAILGVLSKLSYPETVNPIEAINDELIGVAKKFNKFNVLFIKYVIEKYSPEIWEGEPKEVEFDSLPKFSDVSIPMFTDTTDGFV